MEVEVEREMEVEYGWSMGSCEDETKDGEGADGSVEYTAHSTAQHSSTQHTAHGAHHTGYPHHTPLTPARTNVPSSKSSYVAPESRNRPQMAMPTATHVLRVGLALCLKVGTKREKTGVRKRSKPARKAHLLADVREMPHC